MAASQARVLITMSVSALLAAGGNISLRYAMSSISGNNEGWMILLAAFMTPAVLLGLSVYALSHLLWLNVLSQAKLGMVYPIFTGSLAIMVLFGSILFLGEPLTVNRALAAVLVALGVVITEWKKEKRKS